MIVVRGHGVNLALSVGRSAIDWRTLFVGSLLTTEVCRRMQVGKQAAKRRSKSRADTATRGGLVVRAPSSMAGHMAEEAAAVFGAMALASFPLNPSTPHARA